MTQCEGDANQAHQRAVAPRENAFVRAAHSGSTQLDALQTYIDRSPRMLAQRRAIDAAFGSMSGVRGEGALHGQHSSHLAGSGSAVLQRERVQKMITGQSSSVLQRKAGVESFDVQWRKHDDGGGKNAAHEIGFRAKFKHGDGYDATDAEFRQQVKTMYEIKDEQGDVVAQSDSDMEELHDDGYSRATDPEDYSGDHSEKFSAGDIAGFHAASTQLNPTDDIYYDFTAQQQIVDLSDGDKVIAQKGPQTETIWGSHPEGGRRRYSILGDE